MGQSLRRPDPACARPRDARLPRVRLPKPPGRSKRGSRARDRVRPGASNRGEHSKEHWPLEGGDLRGAASRLDRWRRCRGLGRPFAPASPISPTSLRSLRPLRSLSGLSGRPRPARLAAATQLLLLPLQIVSGGAWRSLVAHLLWEQTVAGSNPVAPTTSASRPQLTSRSSIATGTEEESRPLLRADPHPGRRGTPRSTHSQDSGKALHGDGLDRPIANERVEAG